METLRSVTRTQLSHEKSNLTFHCTCCLIGVFRMVSQNPKKTGEDDIGNAEMHLDEQLKKA